MTEIAAQYDKVLSEFPALNDSYEPPKRIGGYRRVDINYSPPNHTDLFLSSWTCWKYRNSEGNTMEITLYYFQYDGESKNRYKVQIHSETKPITLSLVEELTYMVYDQYIKDTGEKNTPEPYPTVVEIALDHTECNPYSHYYSNLNHLFKKNCRKRVEYGGAESAQHNLDGQEGLYRIKGVGTKQYALLPEFQTFYIGGKKSSIYARCYLMFPVEGGDPVYRLEPVFQRDFFERMGVRTLRDLYFVDFVKAWQENFCFVRLDWDRIFKVTDSTPVSNIVRMLQQDTQSFNHNITDTKYPSELDVYDSLKMMPKTSIDWNAIYNQLPSREQAEFTRLWTTPKKYSNPKKSQRMRKPQEIFKEMNLERLTDTTYHQVKERLFYDPSGQILQPAHEFNSYNDFIVDVLKGMVKREPLRYRIQKAISRVSGTIHEKNITEIARIAHCSRADIYRIAKGVASQK